MSLREKIENNPVIWLLGALGTGFLTGVGTYQSIIQIAQLDVVSKARLEEFVVSKAKLEELEARCKANNSSEPSKQVSETADKDSGPAKQQQAQSKQSDRHTDPEKLQTQPSRATETSLASLEPKKELPGAFVSTETTESEPVELKLSETLPPFPERFDLIRPGMKLSEVRTAFPHGKVSSGWYSVEIESGPFYNAVFYTFSRGEDPPIEAIHFFYRSDEAKQLVVSETLRRFGGINHSSESLGAVLSWPDVNGFALELNDNSYKISQRDEE